MNPSNEDISQAAKNAAALCGIKEEKWEYLLKGGFKDKCEQSMVRVYAYLCCLFPHNPLIREKWFTVKRDWLNQRSALEHITEDPNLAYFRLRYIETELRKEFMAG